MAQVKSVWTSVLIGFICLTSLGIGAVVRLQLPVGDGLWILPSHVYLTHAEHSADKLSWAVAAAVIVMFVATGGLRLMRGADVTSKLGTGSALVYRRRLPRQPH